MKRYILAFIFDATYEHVLLIRKNRPEWQRGALNGIGGALEGRELPQDGIRREVREETNLPIEELLPYAQIHGTDWSVAVFCARWTGGVDAAVRMTDEEIVWTPVKELPDSVISNLTWLVPMAIDHLKTKLPQRVEIFYEGHP